MTKEKEITKYEKARIIGARALQIAMGAPLLKERLKKEFNPTNLAQDEFKEGIVPITVKKEEE